MTLRLVKGWGSDCDLRLRLGLFVHAPGCADALGAFGSSQFDTVKHKSR